MPVKIIHTMEVRPERMEERDGWAISEFRLPITGATGSATTVFHSIFRAGSTHAKHLHTRSDEIAVYLSGNGVVGQGDSRAVVSAGHCRLMPKGSVHFFHNETLDEDARVIGFYMNAPDVAGTGYEFHGKVDAADISAPREGLDDGILTHLADTPQTGDGVPEAWSGSTIRAPIGSHNGSENALVHITIPSGRALSDHTFANAEAIYFVASGEGEAAGEPLQAESFVFAPANTAHAIRNTGSGDLELFLVLTGAGSLSDAA